MTVPPRGIRLGGVGIAILAFVVTRLFVAESLEPDAVSFMVAGVVPLVAGLGLTLYGVALAVGACSAAYARSVWVWTALGVGATVVILATTAVHSILTGAGLDPLVRSGPLVGNVLLGGAICGAVVGDRTARSRERETELAKYAERATLVNRLLRHEVLNAATIVKGYAEQLTEDGDAETAGIIRDSAIDIEERVSQLSRFATRDAEVTAVEVEPVLESALGDFADADVTLDLADSLSGRSRVDGSVSGGTVGDGTAAGVTRSSGTLVRSDHRLCMLLRELIENALEHAGPDASVEVRAAATEHAVTLTVSDDGPGLPDPVAALLAAPGLPEQDDPRFGYGLQMVRLLVDHYGGTLDVDTTDGTTISVALQRASDEDAGGPAPGLAFAELYRVAAAATVAGVVMGVLLELLTGAVPTIGRLYAVEGALVGWITHMFHSLLFGIVFAVALDRAPLRRYADTDLRRTLLGTAWGLLLWLFAAGVVMPIWMLAVNADAEFSNLTLRGLVPHLVWGALLGWLYGRLPEPLTAVSEWRLLRGELE